MCLFQFRVRSAYQSNFCDAKFQFKFAHHTRIWVIQFCENRGILSDKSLRRRIIPGMDDLRKEDSREQYFILTTFPSDRYFK